MKKNTNSHDASVSSDSWESNDIFRLIFENSPVGKSITGIDGKLKVNQAFCNMLGYSMEEMQRLHWMGCRRWNTFGMKENIKTANLVTRPWFYWILRCRDWMG